MMVGGDYGLGVPTSRRETQRAKQNKRDRKKQTPLQDQTPADVRGRGRGVRRGHEGPDVLAALNAELRAAFKEDPSSLSADDRARAEQLLARDARKAAKKAARASESA